MPFVVTSCAFKIHRASGRGRGKPVLLFAVDLPERSKSPFFKLGQCI